jgi:hypothetical protein
MLVERLELMFERDKGMVYAAGFARSHARKPPIKPSQRLAFVGPD